MITSPEISRLVWAVLNCLDDMPGDGEVRVCELSKAELRIAVQPFVTRKFRPTFTLKSARLIIRENQQ